MGKESESLGDSLDGFEADLTQDQIDAFFTEPRGRIATGLLGDATSRIVYDVTRFQRLGATAPGFAATLARETHASDPLSAAGLKIQVSLAYSDGFGRVIQSKAQAEPGPIEPEGAVVEPRWVGSGWTVFNNKGKPVRQYEPFFTDTDRFEFDVRIGVSPVIFYDPVERVVATLHPNHTWEKVIFDPWRQETWDVNDTVLIADPAEDAEVGDFFRRLPTADYLPTWHAQRVGGELGSRERSAAAKTAVHANTPTVAHFDTLGRPFLTIAHNRFERDGVTVDESYPTRVELDIEGNQRAVRDAIVQAGDPLGRIVMRYDYDMLSTQIHSASMEAGERWMLNDVSGKPIRAWDSRGHALRSEYDALRRPVHSFVQGSDPENPEDEILFGRTEFGEGQPDAAALNLRTRVFRVFDTAGIVTSEAYDFKGNLLSGSRQLAADYRATPNWSGEPVLEADLFRSSTTHDALNRPVTLTTPDNSIVRPGYSEANLLDSVQANLRGSAIATEFIRDIDYNAKGQRVLIEYGNDVRTEYRYDPDTFRLTRLTTTRQGFAADERIVQDLSYVDDPIGNITDLRDDAQQTIYFNNAFVEPHADYTYDAVYRLIAAIGREHIGQLAAPQTSWNDEGRVRLPHPHDGQAMRRYTEQYDYDGVGNFLRMIHLVANGGSWTRAYAYKEASLIEPGKQSNRLSRTRVGASNEPYTHDVHGNMTSMPHLPLMRWDFQNRLQANARQVVNAGTPEITYYVYDAVGERVRKVTERQAAAGETPARMHERIYLGGFEVYREYENDGTTATLERETLHIMDDQERIALVETRTEGDDGSPAQLIRYQLGNHLGSASLELDAEAGVISYEEYHPYGSTAYQAGRSVAEVSLKRYRYTGKERDEETGLNYHGARYYAPWLGRWTAADPIGISGGLNLYTYSANNPVSLLDPSGFVPQLVTDQYTYAYEEPDQGPSDIVFEDELVIGQAPSQRPRPKNDLLAVERPSDEAVAAARRAEVLRGQIQLGKARPPGLPESATAVEQGGIVVGFVGPKPGKADNVKEVYSIAGEAVGEFVTGNVEKDFTIEMAVIDVLAVKGALGLGRAAFLAALERRAVQKAIRAEAELLAAEEAAGLAPGSLPARVGDFLPQARTFTAAQAGDTTILNSAVPSRVWPQHHAFPKYLGGAVDQTLTKIPRHLHYRFHAALDKWKGGKYARSLGAEHFKNMSREKIIRDLRDFYRKAEGGAFKRYLRDFEQAVAESL